MKRIKQCQLFAIFFLAASIIYVHVFVVVLRRPALLPSSPSVSSDPPAAIAVKPVATRSAPVIEPDPVAVSSAVAAVCGADATTVGRYEARNDALRSIARRRDLPKEDVAALTAWLASSNDPLRAERLAALKKEEMGTDPVFQFLKEKGDKR